MNLVLLFAYSVALAFVVADIWLRAIAPLGLMPVSPIACYAAFAIFGLYRMSSMTMVELAAYSEAYEALSSTKRWAISIARFIGLAVSYGLFRILEWRLR